MLSKLKFIKKKASSYCCPLIIETERVFGEITFIIIFFRSVLHLPTSCDDESLTREKK